MNDNYTILKVHRAWIFLINLLFQGAVQPLILGCHKQLAGSRGVSPLVLKWWNGRITTSNIFTQTGIMFFPVTLYSIGFAANFAEKFSQHDVRSDEVLRFSSEVQPPHHHNSSSNPQIAQRFSAVVPWNRIRDSGQ